MVTGYEEVTMRFIIFSFFGKLYTVFGQRIWRGRENGREREGRETKGRN